MLRSLSILVAGFAIVACVHLWLSPSYQPSQGAGRETANDAVAVVVADQDTVLTATISTIQPKPTPTPTPTAILPPLRTRVRLGPITQVWQTLGNCGPATLSMLLSYYGVKRSQAEIAEVLKPRLTDPGVPVDMLASYAQGLGFDVRVGVNGSLDLLIGIVNLDLPVIVHQVVDYDGGSAHFCLVSGYDKSRGVIVFDDAYYGPNREMSLSSFDAEWQLANRTYILIYPPAKEALVAAVLGADWDQASMLARAVRVDEEWCAREPGNAFAHFALGESLMAVGQVEAALSSYERAFALGMPKRTLWYFQGPVEALVATGRYTEALQQIDPVLAVAPDVDELHYLRGLALDGLGQYDEAREAYQRALAIRPGYAAAQQALATPRRT